MDKVYIIFRSDVERARELREFARSKGWSEEELERAGIASRRETYEHGDLKWDYPFSSLTLS